MKLTGKRCAMAATLMLTILMVTLPASAAVGPYFGIEGGVSDNPDTGIDSTVTVTPTGSTTGTTASGSGKLRFDKGFVGGATLGYALPGHLRPELEVDYRRNTVRDSGDAVSAITTMANLWYDFETRHNYFYLGVGLGDAHVKLSQSFGTSSHDQFAYQFGLGAGFIVSPRISIGLDYRYLAAASRSSFSFSGAYDAGGQTGHQRESDRLRYHSQSLMLGLRWNFGYVWDPLNPYRRSQSVRVVPLDSDD